MEITRVVKRKNGGISISFIDDDGEEYGLLLRPEQIVANWKAVQTPRWMKLGYLSKRPITWSAILLESTTELADIIQRSPHGKKNGR